MATKIGDVIGKIADGMVKEPVKYPVPPREKLVDGLEHFGFSSVIAGKEDFDKAVKAIELAIESGRGIVICGGNGVGKTVLMRAIYDMFYKRAHRRYDPFSPQTYYHVANWIDLNDERQLQWLTDDDLLREHVFLDDFGSERMLYGDVDAVGAFICKWHSRHCEGRRFYMTTNLTPEQINDRSGGRVLDRLCEDCVFVKLEGDSKRKVIKVI